MSQMVELLGDVMSKDYLVWTNGRFTVPMFTGDKVITRSISISWDTKKLKYLKANLRISARCDHGATRLSATMNDDLVADLSWGDAEDNKEKLFEGDVTLSLKNGTNRFNFDGHNDHWFTNGITFYSISVVITIEFEQLVQGATPPTGGQSEDITEMDMKELITYAGIGLGCVGTGVGLISFTSARKEAAARAARARRERKEEKEEKKERQEAEERRSRRFEEMLLLTGRR